MRQPDSVVRPGGLPIEQGVAVFNVETVYNVYRAVEVRNSRLQTNMYLLLQKSVTL